MVYVFVRNSLVHWPSQIKKTLFSQLLCPHYTRNRKIFCQIKVNKRFIRSVEAKNGLELQNTNNPVGPENNLNQKICCSNSNKSLGKTTNPFTDNMNKI